MAKGDYEVIELFPIPVFATFLDDIDNTEIDNVLREKHEGMFLNELNNFRSENVQLLNEMDMVDLKISIMENVDFYLNEVLGIYNTESYISGSWYNLNPKGSRHHKHEHVNSFVSGVYYVRTEHDAGGQIIFSRKDTFSWITPRLKQDKNNGISKYMATTFPVQPQPNMLLLFPSTLQHHVSEYLGEIARVSIAFNVFLKGDLGESDTLTHLTI